MKYFLDPSENVPLSKEEISAVEREISILINDYVIHSSDDLIVNYLEDFPLFMTGSPDGIVVGRLKLEDNKIITEVIEND